MIVKSRPSGRSFKWLAEYLTHDPGKAETSKRVGFVHSLNVAHDDAGGAVHSMLQTYRDREVLKKEAGVRAGGSSITKPVKHISMAWHVSENPSDEAMIAAAQSYLKAMGWQDHECLVVSHTDTKHPHLHLMINRIHPERGTALNDSYEYRRTQAWALGYEREMGQVFCTERLKPVTEREPSPPRPVWEQLRKLQPEPSEGMARPRLRVEISYDAAPRVWKRQEWEAIRACQKEERLAFFERGRSAYRSLRQEVYREVREAYRAEWREFYGLKKTGASRSVLSELRAGLVARQKATLQDRCREAGLSLRANRDEFYKSLLTEQQRQRKDLVERQEQGLKSPHLAKGRDVQPAKADASRLEPLWHQPRTPGWTARGGMVAQQRAASRWASRAIDRLERGHARPEAGDLSRRREMRAGLRRSHRTKEAVTDSLGIEPDG